MIDLNKLMNDALVQIEEEKFVEGVIKKRLEGAIKSIVDDCFDSYSKFGKGLKEHVQEGLNINFEKLGISKYNGLVLAAVQEQLDKAITIQGVEKVKASMEKLLSDAKSEYTLSEIIEQLKEDASYDDKNEDDEVTLIIKDSDYGYYHIYLDNEGGKEKYKCDYQINIDKEGKPYSLKLKDKTIDTSKILGGLFGLDALLFKIYSSGATIKMDKGTGAYSYDLNYEGEEDY